jgi:hypothetical protein
VSSKGKRPKMKSQNLNMYMQNLDLKKMNDTSIKWGVLGRTSKRREAKRRE